MGPVADNLDWLDDAELELIGTMRSSLAEELASAPVELQHDHQFARFLRGHSHNVERATEKMRGALRFRTALASKEPYRSCHAAAPGRTTIDLSVLPHAEWVLTHLPVRTVDGMTADELPLSLSVTRLFDFAKQPAEKEAQVDEFLTAMIEQRALVVHNLSVKQRRMVKCVDLRDLTGTSVKEIITRGRHTLAKMQRFISTVQDHYPELIHRAFVFNAPSAFSQLFALISPILNERMRSKVRVFPTGHALGDVLGRLQPRAVWSWLAQATVRLDGADLAVASLSTPPCLPFYIPLPPSLHRLASLSTSP